MSDGQPIRVRVTEELVLDAGVLEASRSEWILHPPAVSMFHQLLTWLETKPNPPRPSGSRAGREGLATVAVTLRWGSYLAVLLDGDKPMWTEARSRTTSRVSDPEMARINLEASAALAEWIGMQRADPEGSRFCSLVDRAAHFLPLPSRRVRIAWTPLVALATPEGAQLLANVIPAEQIRVLAHRVSASPGRVMANALINVAWRNGPVEDLHAGAFRGQPLDRRRFRSEEERDLVTVAAERLATGMDVCRYLSTERHSRPWPDQVLPFALATVLGVTPVGWSLDEASREIRFEADPLGS